VILPERSAALAGDDSIFSNMRNPFHMLENVADYAIDIPLFSSAALQKPRFHGGPCRGQCASPTDLSRMLRSPHRGSVPDVES